MIISVKGVMRWLYHMWRLFCMFLPILCQNIWFYTHIYDEVAKMMSATLLEDILRIHQLTKNPLNYVHTNSKYGCIVVILDSDSWSLFSISVIHKGWVDTFILHQSDRKEVKNVSMVNYLSNYMFDKNEYEAFVAAFQCGLPVRCSMNP